MCIDMCLDMSREHAAQALLSSHRLLTGASRLKLITPWGRSLARLYSKRDLCKRPFTRSLLLSQEQ